MTAVVLKGARQRSVRSGTQAAFFWSYRQRGIIGSHSLIELYCAVAALSFFCETDCSELVITGPPSLISSSISLALISFFPFVYFQRCFNLLVRPAKIGIHAICPISGQS